MNGTLVVSVGAGLVALVLTATLLGPLTAWLRRRALLDVPNDRSSHRAPTPRGGGIVVTAAVVAGWAGVLAWTATFTADVAVLLIAAVALGGLSWLDDMHHMPRRLRFAAHGLAVAAVLALLPGDMLVAQGLLPLWLDRLIAGLAWLWFVNLFNFMDGIDGISGAEGAHLGLGVAIVALVGGLGGTALPMAGLGAVVAGAALGFLAWNWHPAKVFLGDVGSIPLGYLIGFLLLVLAASGAWAAALLLPAYYLADATWTLLRRIAEGKSPVEAHREHFYQQACHRRGLRHDAVVLRLTAVNVGLLGALLLLPPVPALVIGLGLVGGLMAWFGRAPAARDAAEEARPR